LNIEEPRGMTL